MARRFCRRWPPPLVWWPVTATYFHHDDFLNLYELVNWPTSEFLTRMRGGHLLVTRNVIFLLHHWLSGTRPELYMGAVWLTHLLNVALLHRVVLRMTARRALAGFGATLWGIAAVNVGTLNWYSVYGQVLALTAVLLVLLGLLRRETDGDPRWSPLVVWSMLLVAASSSFGTGLGMTLAMPLVALLWLSPSSGRRRALAVLTGTASAMVVIYLLLQSADIAAHHGVSTGAYLAAARRRWTETATFFAHLFACGATSLLLSTWYEARALPRAGGVSRLGRGGGADGRRTVARSGLDAALCARRNAAGGERLRSHRPRPLLHDRQARVRLPCRALPLRGAGDARDRTLGSHERRGRRALAEQAGTPLAAVGMGRLGSSRLCP